jgi:hypothetical protein
MKVQRLTAPSKISRQASKIMATVFWDFEGVPTSCSLYLPPGHTITGEYYAK